jgi:hypothetical protein
MVNPEAFEPKSEGNCFDLPVEFSAVSKINRIIKSGVNFSSSSGVENSPRQKGDVDIGVRCGRQCPGAAREVFFCFTRNYKKWRNFCASIGVIDNNCGPAV